MTKPIKTQQFENAADVVTGFYHFVGKKDFKSAFACLSEDFRKRIWGDNLEDFVDGYKSLIEMSEALYMKTPAALDEKKESDVYEEGVVYFKTKKKAYYLKDKNDMHDGNVMYNAEVKDLDKFTAGVKKYKNIVVHALGGDPEKFDNIRLKHFQTSKDMGDPNWLAKANAEKYLKYFDVVEETTENTMKPVCVKDNEGWKIAGLKYFPFLIPNNPS